MEAEYEDLLKDFLLKLGLKFYPSKNVEDTRCPKCLQKGSLKRDACGHKIRCTNCTFHDVDYGKLFKTK